MHAEEGGMGLTTIAKVCHKLAPHFLGDAPEHLTRQRANERDPPPARRGQLQMAG